MTPAGAAPPTRSRAGTIVPPTKSRPVVPTRTMTDVTTTAATTAAAAIDAMTTTRWTISTVSGRNSPNFCTAQRAATGRRTAVIPTFAAETTSPATMWMSVMIATVVTRIVTTSVSSVLRPAGCGLEVVDVNRLLKQFEMMQDLVKQMTRGRMPKGLGGFGGKRPNLPAGRKGAGIGMSVIVGLAVLAWGATGFYIVPEGQSGIVTTFGRYAETTAAGFRWHLPMPIQDVQIVDVSSVRTTEIGFAGRSDRLREALMLTDDENIVDVQFTVQYRIKPGDGARDYVFRIRQPDLTVTQAAESAMREVVGRKAMDSVLFESKAEIAEAVKKSMQDMLDRYSSGIEVMSVAIQNAQPPQQVQAAFNDAVKAGQDRERSINLGEAYRNAVIPKAEGTAARLKEEALGYQARIVETARGDADRFSALQSQYARAPEVTRDRLYVDTVRDVMKNVTKVYVDAKGGNNLLYLPLDKIVNNTKSDAMTQAQKEAAALADHGVTAAQSAVETTGSAQPTTSSAAPGDEYQRMLRDRR